MSSVLDRQSRYQSGPHAMGCIVSTYDGSPAVSSSLSQPASATEFGGAHDRSLTLPRQRHGPATSPVPAASRSRRQIVSSRVSDYLKSLNSMTRSIVLEKEYVEERHAGEWPVMDETLQEEVVDDYFMPPDVHAHYGTLPPSRRSSLSGSYREPRCSSSNSNSNSDQSRLFSSTRVMPVSLQPLLPGTYTILVQNGLRL